MLTLLLTRECCLLDAVTPFLITECCLENNQQTKALTREATCAKAHVDLPRSVHPSLRYRIAHLNYNWDSAYANDFPSRLKTPTWAS